MKKKGSSTRPSWDSYFMQITRLVATRSTCLRRKVGAIIVMDKRILATGYNGAPRNLPHCSETGCLREKFNVPSGERHELCRGIHAEQNAIIQAATHGISIKNSVLYSTHYPCSICIKMIINSGIKKVYYLEGYPDKLAKSIVDQSDLEIIKIEIDEK